jgi:ribosomal protein S18 acetylase RimI-like enzyme
MVSIRRATPDDATAMWQVAQAAYAGYVPRMGRRPHPMDVDYEGAVARDEAWVAVIGGEVVGYVVLVDEGDTMLLDNVAVLPAHHGRGVGRALLTHADRRAVAAGCSRIRLYTHLTMVENQALYERIGYVETGRGGEDGLVRVFYEKKV